MSEPPTTHINYNVVSRRYIALRRAQSPMPPIAALNLREVERLAAEKLDVNALSYYRSGADDERTLADDGFARLVLRPRMLVDVSSVSTAVTVLGERWSSPIAVAPMAAHGLAHVDGELATARAAQRAGLVLALSTMSTTPLEAVARERRPGGPAQWFQLYCFRDRQLTESLVRRAEAAGFSALVLTADAPVLGRRESDMRGGFALPPHLRFANLTPELGDGAGTSRSSASAIQAFFASQIDASLTWDVIAWLRSITRLPILVKGILTAEDADAAVRSGCAGIISSNHGGRQLDGVAASIEALPEVVEGAGGRVPVLLDGGIRRGTDVLKALARGATAVLLGRPVLYGLALNGEEGVLQVLEMLHAELRQCMQLAGCAALPPPASLVAERRGSGYVLPSSKL